MAENTRHSPSPWRKRRHGLKWVITSGIPGRDLLVLATIECDGENPAQTEADADVMTAAPEMLKALQTEEYAQALANHPDSQQQARVARERADDLRRAAIAKATGGQP